MLAQVIQLHNGDLHTSGDTSSSKVDTMDRG